MISRGARSGCLTALSVAVAMCASTYPAQAQDTAGSTWAMIGGGALGLYSSGLAGAVGSLIPCGQTYGGAKCVRIAGALTGAVGLASGIYLGDADRDRVIQRAKGAGAGLLVGAATGAVLKPFIQRFGWQDVAAVGLVGSAVGASAKGSVIGLGVGSVLGVTLWQTVPGFESPDVIGAALMGVAIGAVAGWVLESVDAQTVDAEAQPRIILPLRFTF